MSNFLDSILDLTPAVDQPTPLAPKKELKIPTREEFDQAILGLITGTIYSPIGRYDQIKEDPGRSNRSLAIDTMIKLQGGNLGDPYCQLGQQQVLDDLCAHFGVKRKYVEIPEGGSTQLVYNVIPEKYKMQNPASGYWVTWVVDGTYKGHVGMCLSGGVNGQFKTFEFNTTIKKDGGVVRDGEGFAIAMRKQSGMGSMKVRGYVDIYAAIVDGIKKQLQYT
jgi:hypothetical protein